MKTTRYNFDCKLKFNKHIEDICKKASQKINAVVRLAPTWEQPKNSLKVLKVLKQNLSGCF